jgi:hypothetical protein
VTLCFSWQIISLMKILQNWGIIDIQKNDQKEI